MTEDEAKTKWCPATRITPDFVGGRTDNKLYNGIITYCIGSGCMAWRWNISPEQLKDATYCVGDKKLFESGYCGLAGNIGI